ncbi:MAG: IS3 family transposase, partial [Clostridia bacterium]|nr:IS3 family transposase [Clostridia bacterium]
WFGIIQRQLIRRGEFKSVEELEQMIKAFIEQWNNGYAHPFNWTYNSVPKAQNERKVS